MSSNVSQLHHQSPGEISNRLLELGQDHPSVRCELYLGKFKGGCTLRVPGPRNLGSKTSLNPYEIEKYFFGLGSYLCLTIPSYIYML